MLRYLTNRTSVISVVAFLYTPLALADDSWSMEILPQVMFGAYKDSQLRDSIIMYGAFFTASYLDNGGMSIGYNRTTINGKSTGPDIEESALYLSGRYNRLFDNLSGELLFRFDAYLVENKSRFQSSSTGTVVIPGPGMGNGKNKIITTTSNSTITFNDDITAFNPIIAYTNYTKSIYLDLGYAHSSYRYDDSIGLQDNTVQQFTPSAGFAWNNRFDWLLTRAYIIRLKQGNTTNGKTSSNAFEIKWTHWYGPQAILGLHSSGINLLLGKRLFPIDPDAGVIYSIADQQNSSVSASLRWRLTEKIKLAALIGYNQFTNLAIEDYYNNIYGYSNISIKW